ncbi:MAG: hypothetical protein ABIO24_08880, partial [Saprospiraceae bacterium]
EMARNKEQQMTKEERAKIARENGAKSKGPKTETGKQRSARNALKDGSRAEKFAAFVPPHEAVVCNEDRKAYLELVDDLVAIYKPLNQSAFAAVGDMAAARWQIQRLNSCITIQWNLALMTNGRKPASRNLAPELLEIKAMADTCAELLSGDSVLTKLNKEIARLQIVIGRAERRIKFIHANFPDFAPARKQTQETEEENVDNKDINEPQPETREEELPPIFTSEDSPAVIEAYKREFPGRRIVIVAPENVDYGDKTPRRPRRAA